MENYNLLSPLQTNDYIYNYDSSTTGKSDTEYVLFLLPKDSRLIKKLIDELLDQYEYSGSIIYDEFPDKTRLLKILDQVYDSPNTSLSSMHNLVESIFFYEIINRRRRYFNYINNIVTS